MNFYAVSVSPEGAITQPGWGTDAMQLSGDPFAQIIAQMVAQMLEGGEDATQNMDALMGLLQNAQLPEGLDGKEPDLLAMQELASAYLFGTQQQMQTPYTPEEALQALLTAGGLSAPETAHPAPQTSAETTAQPENDILSAPSTWQAAAENAQETPFAGQETAQAVEAKPEAAQMRQPAQIQLAEAASSTERPRQTANTPKSTFTVQSAESHAEKPAQEQPVVQSVHQAAGQNVSPDQERYSLETSFRDAVATVKLKLGSQKQETTGEIDVDQLQSQVKTSRVGMFETLLRAEKTEAPAPSLPSQLETGITEHLRAGEREFRIKLNPESLGEITVSVVEKAGKMALSIATASEQTARLINNDLGALRAAVSNLQVDVQEAVVQTAESHGAALSDMGAQQQFNMSQQQFAQNQARHSGFTAQAGETPDETQPVELSMEASGLDTYI